LIYGAAGIQRHLSEDADYAARFVQECGILVPELELKWDRVRPTPTTYSFDAGDWLAEFAQRYNMLFRGHTLVWHKALPEWFESTVNAQNAESTLQNHISTVVGHYSGQMHSWDVVNEAIDPSDGQPGGLRTSPWLSLLGPEYIEMAFSIASEADPKALLVYNETGLDYDVPYHEAKRNAVLELLQRLKAKRIPIHALGIQAHLSASETRFNAAKLQQFLKQVANLDIKILITEMDVKDQNLPVDIASRDAVVARVYEEYLGVVLEERAVIGVLTWGLSDRYTWLSTHAPRSDKAPVRPLPLDENCNRKLSWNAIAGAFDKAPIRVKPPSNLRIIPL
jgi:endo-1,4-beta-xylanase